MQPAQKRVVISKYSQKDILIGVVIGILAVAAITAGIVSMNRGAGGGWVSGQVTGREFIPQEPETQITLQRGGSVSSRTIDGRYILKVYVSQDKKTYDVIVGKADYDRVHEGEQFRFLKQL